MSTSFIPGADLFLSYDCLCGCHSYSVHVCSGDPPRTVIAGDPPDSSPRGRGIKQRSCFIRLVSVSPRFQSIMVPRAFLVYKANALFKAVGCVNVLETAKNASISLRLLGSPGFLLILWLCTESSRVTYLGSRHGMDAPARCRGGRVSKVEVLWQAVAWLALLGMLLPSYLAGVFNLDIDAFNLRLRWASS